MSFVEGEHGSDYEKYDHSLLIHPEVQFSFLRAGVRMGDYSQSSVFIRGLMVLKSYVDFSSKGKEIIASSQGSIVAESLSSKVLDAARNGKPDENWLRERSRNITEQGYTYFYSDEVNEFIKEIEDTTGIDNHEVLAEHAGKALDWTTYKISNNAAIGALDKDNLRVGVVKIDFMDYKIPMSEAEDNLSRVQIVVPVSVNII